LKNEEYQSNEPIPLVTQFSLWAETPFACGFTCNITQTK